MEKLHLLYNDISLNCFCNIFYNTMNNNKSLNIR